MVQKRKVTIKEIATEAGVSTQTVSRVLNDRPDVAPETRKRIQTIIDQWSYQPNQAARSLIRGKSNAIGVVISGLPKTGPSKFLAGIETSVRKLGYTLILHLVSNNDERNINQSLNHMLASRVDGLIWASVPTDADNINYLHARLANLEIPVVVNGIKPHPQLALVEVDNRFGGRIATEHLIDRGYKKIGIITGNIHEWSARQRLDGWRMALNTATLPHDDSLIFYGDWSPASGVEGIRHLWERHPQMDALFVSNDQMALGVLHVVQQWGKKIPADLGVVGFDNILEAEFFTPPLTTVQQNIFQSAQSAVSELSRLMQSANGFVEPKTTIVNPQLIVRQSS